MILAAHGVAEAAVTATLEWLRGKNLFQIELIPVFTLQTVANDDPDASWFFCSFDLLLVCQKGMWLV